MRQSDQEIRCEVNRLKVAKKEAKALDAAFDEGRFDFTRGLSRDGCRFRNSARRNAWERGWLDSERERQEHDAVKGISELEKAETRRKLSTLRAMIGE